MKKREERHCVDLVVTLTDLIPPFFLPPCYPPNPVPRSLVLPTSSPGNKDFHSCAWGDPQQGRRGEKMRKRRGHQGRTVWGSQGSGPQPQIVWGFFVCIFFPATVLTNGLLFQIWWQPCHSMHILGKFGGNVFKLAPIQDSNTGTNTAAEYAQSFRTRIFLTKSPFRDMLPPHWAWSGVWPPEHLCFRLL